MHCRLKWLSCLTLSFFLSFFACLGNGNFLNFRLNVLRSERWKRASVMRAPLQIKKHFSNLFNKTTTPCKTRRMHRMQRKPRIHHLQDHLRAMICNIEITNLPCFCREKLVKNPFHVFVWVTVITICYLFVRPSSP